MIRTTLMALTALAATVALAAPASAEDSILVKLTGKTAAAAFADIHEAARTVCSLPGDLHGLVADDVCVRETVAVTVAKIASPNLSRYADSREARMQLASN